MNNTKTAFTLSETLVVLIVLGAIAMLTLGSFLKTDNITEEKIKILSKKFYTSVEGTYQKIIYNYTGGTNNILNITSASLGAEASTNLSAILKERFIQETGAEDLANCSELNYGVEGQNLSCVWVEPGIYAGFYVNPQCNTSLNNVFEYRGKEQGQVTNACGYVVYGIGKNHATLGENVFIIPLGKKGLKRVPLAAPDNQI